MTTLLIIIYISFISLGLPDAIMGASWPTIHKDLGIDVSLVGIFAMIVSTGTVIASLLSGKIIEKFGTGKVTALSVLLTALGLLGIGLLPNYLLICMLAIPLGLGAGAVDSALNNFVALHYKAVHMHWLHCFWGIGATAGPMIISYNLSKDYGWASGYKVIACFQMLLFICLLVTQNLWKNAETPPKADAHEVKKPTTFLDSLKLSGAKESLLSFFCYCAVEASVGLWGASYLVTVHNTPTNVAAIWIGVYYSAITIGRIIAGFMSLKISNKTMIAIGQFICISGAFVLLMPLGKLSVLIAFVLIGLGCAPIFPAMLHETPARFGSKRSQSLMGIQMASAYVGITLMPPLFGLCAKFLGMKFFPLYIIVLAFIMLIGTTILNKKLQKR